ncbi:FAD-dependent oxidoreductase [Eggerthella sp. YY7918]|uniref:oxidoreductase n=1 Tax=Eggerthella sp. (strain YY7918) TaxID=502558 RepID=UPI00021710F9|nr:FAD-dependent oxidoreductase [Eggerthella sp. YY7918]BAK43550.1 NADH:flavin oxidoreductase [Eggerthella sp. YY7918]
MSTQYPLLGSPLQVNGITLKNRMITTSMSPGHGYVENNIPTDRLAAYLEERAAGQTAMIIQTICPWKRTEVDGFHPLPTCYDDSCIPDLQKYMIEPVHKHGGLICAQPYYVHDWKPDDETPEGPYGPSDIAILKFMGGFRAMTLEQIEAFKQQYFNAARVCKKAGFDAIEVMAGVGGILSRFMTQATNNRTDQYGGSLENRARLACEVIRGVREVVGPDFPIVVRWSPIDFIKSPAGPGLSMDEALQIAPMLEEAGCDLHDLAVGWHETSEPLTTKVIDDGHWTWISEKIKSVAKKPVAQGYRNSDPKVMEQNLQDGKVDVIAGLRYSIADPDLPRKVMEDRTDDMRLCIVCCRCLDDVVSQQKPLEFCGVNPRLGPELDHEAFPKAEKPKKVMVVGSGPAGINAALTAAQRGHTVDLYEQGPRLGGSVKMSSIFSPYHERYLNYLLTQVKKHPEITVHLKTEVTPDVVRAAKPDAVIVAVGGHATGLDVPGNDGKNVITSHDFLEMINGHKPEGKKGAFNNFMWGAGTAFLKHYYTPSFARMMTAKSTWPISRNVAIIGGGLPGCEFGHLCMETGRTTAIIEERKKVGFDVGGSDRFGLINGFKKAENVELYPLTRVVEITDEGVKAVQTTAEGEEKELFIPAKTVAITLNLSENHDLGEALKPLAGEIYLVGDCDSPGRIADATKAGYRAACAL